MHAVLVSDPAVPGEDEDAAGVLGDAAVLVDGAGLPPALRAGCRHSVAWYSHRLAARLLVALQDPGLDLREALRRAIAEVAASHGDGCALEAGSPSGTVVAVRAREGRLEHLVLCDSSLLVETSDGRVDRLTDPRLDGVLARTRDVGRVEALRNAPDGFWVARHEPEAADHALCGSRPLDGLVGVHLVSDGVTRAADLLGLMSDAELARALDRDPRAVIGRIRAAERELAADRVPRKRHDDATVLSLRDLG